MAKFGGLGDIGKMAKLMKNFGKIQEEMQQQQSELEATEVSGESGAGACKVVMTAKHHLISVKINDEIWQEGKEVVEDLIIAAHNDACQKADQLMQEKMSDMTNMFGADEK